MPARSTARIRVGAKRQVTLPREITRKLRLNEGDDLEVRIQDDRIELVPLALIPRDQLWFWTPEWQAMEREADEDKAAGRVKRFKSAKALIASLKK
ncbi:MAG TPA: AbrB/MazE/SpoVT family DNA-binding domain-containing protein [Candidatus Acidoferrales bacterium]|jgi:AbrB family looped-hinge helix DNA binding protein|nr:AbrB/MazE/SpoVT family DNA-binding domain-containing protein [Candidatus Acidoferrales bacterium]